MLGVYFRFWRDLLKSFNPERPLYYVDLYCGDGDSYDETTREKYETPLIISLIKKGVLDKHLDIRFLLNDSNQESIAKLKKKIQDLGINKEIIDIDSIDANVYVDKALAKVPKEEFSVFFIDPFNYKDLKWETIEKISKHKGDKYGRRPEMIINLPLYTLGKGMESKHFEKMDEFFGTDAWLKKVNEYKALGHERPVFNALLEFYVERLKTLGYKVEFEEISSIGNSAPIYYIIFAVGNNEAYKIVERALTFVRGAKQKWTKDKVAKRDKLKGAGKGGKGLDHWM